MSTLTQLHEPTLTLTITYHDLPRLSLWEMSTLTQLHEPTLTLTITYHDLLRLSLWEMSTLTQLHEPAGRPSHWGDCDDERIAMRPGTRAERPLSELRR